MVITGHIEKLPEGTGLFKYFVSIIKTHDNGDVEIINIPARSEKHAEEALNLMAERLFIRINSPNY